MIERRWRGHRGTVLDRRMSRFAVTLALITELMLIAAAAVATFQP